ncbi:MAG: hypothetical protein U5L09_15155 [Bacteroidales bacterium]|nr:hypothetical protein [Bacteroidales bacterium]
MRSATISILNEEQAYILENEYKGFIRSGANLSDEDKEKLKEYNSTLSSLALEFGQNVLAETNNFEVVIEDKEDLAGLLTALSRALPKRQKSAATKANGF